MLSINFQLPREAPRKRPKIRNCDQMVILNQGKSTLSSKNTQTKIKKKGAKK